jgi:Dimerisation domain
VSAPGRGVDLARARAGRAPQTLRLPAAVAGRPRATVLEWGRGASGAVRPRRPAEERDATWNHWREPGRTNIAPALLMETQIAFGMTRSIMAGVKLGIYDAIGAGARTADEVAATCKTDPGATTKLMNTLVGCRYLRHRDARYELTPNARNGWSGTRPIRSPTSSCSSRRPGSDRARTRRTVEAVFVLCLHPPQSRPNSPDRDGVGRQRLLGVTWWRLAAI